MITFGNKKVDEKSLTDVEKQIDIDNKHRSTSESIRCNLRERMISLFNIDQKLNEIKSDISSDDNRSREKSLIDDTNDDYKYIISNDMKDKNNYKSDNLDIHSSRNNN